MPTKSVLIGYDLNSPGQDYDSLFEAIKELGTWWHHLDSTWVVKTTKTTVEVRDTLKGHIDSNDELLVVALTGKGAWTGFNDRGSKWLKDNL
ncbi:CRISPR-associated protein Cas2 [Streptomyces goshikiensis]|uniref:CRISPR-associated protein Cas2 n=1 Tax=Streptomyces goshikiensis TaxID=1942 RepID=UPI003665AE4F